MEIVVDIVGEIVLGFVFDVVMVGTGEVVLWGLTGGEHEPRWDLYTSEDASEFVVHSELSGWVGIATWLIALTAVYQLI